MLKNLVELDKRSLSAKFRQKRFALVMQLITRVYEEKGSVSIIDLGGRWEYWAMCGIEGLAHMSITLTIVNDESDLLPARDAKLPGITVEYLKADACDLAKVADNEFDLAHSNSLIEHVGGWKDIHRCLQEHQRVAKYIYIQTPSPWFPIEQHAVFPFVHWLPPFMVAYLLTLMPIGRWAREPDVIAAHMRLSRTLLVHKGFLQAALGCGVVIKKERLFGFVKSYIAYSKLGVTA